MSRDLTPVQHYLLSEHHKKDGMSSFDVMESTVWVINGEKTPLHSKEEMDLRRQYPLFGYLLNTFCQTHDKLSRIPGGLELFKKREEELSNYIQTSVADPNKVLIRWFEGELDENFYYSERNEELFVESLLKEAREAARKPLDAQISSAASRVADPKIGVKTQQKEMDR